MLKKKQQRYMRHKRVRAKVSGTKERPRLYVFRSSKHIYTQLINDEKGHTILSLSDLELKKSKRGPRKREGGGWVGVQISKSKIKETKNEEKTRTGKIAIAYEVGKLIAEKAKELKIGKVVFDRGGYRYHGRVKALAEGAREGGLKF